MSQNSYGDVIKVNLAIGKGFLMLIVRHTPSLYFVYFSVRLPENYRFEPNIAVPL